MCMQWTPAEIASDTTSWTISCVGTCCAKPNRVISWQYPSLKEKHLLLDSSYSLCQAGLPHSNSTRALHRHFPFARNMDGASCNHYHEWHTSISQHTRWPWDFMQSTAKALTEALPGLAAWRPGLPTDIPRDDISTPRAVQEEEIAVIRATKVDQYEMAEANPARAAGTSSNEEHH